uniref:Uncharacterized protein n=1 Tax=Mycena chlorophos TaxID=658473 RepID=A0ABQ0LAR0_MYCCL|nr:predicted protein [Mycena chlorophos]
MEIKDLPDIAVHSQQPQARMPPLPQLPAAAFSNPSPALVAQPRADDRSRAVGPFQSTPVRLVPVIDAVLGTAKILVDPRQFFLSFERRKTDLSSVFDSAEADVKPVRRKARKWMRRIVRTQNVDPPSSNDAPTSFFRLKQRQEAGNEDDAEPGAAGSVRAGFQPRGEIFVPNARPALVPELVWGWVGLGHSDSATRPFAALPLKPGNSPTNASPFYGPYPHPSNSFSSPETPENVAHPAQPASKLPYPPEAVPAQLSYFGTTNTSCKYAPHTIWPSCADLRTESGPSGGVAPGTSGIPRLNAGSAEPGVFQRPCRGPVLTILATKQLSDDLGFFGMAHYDPHDGGRFTAMTAAFRRERDDPEEAHQQK